MKMTPADYAIHIFGGIRPLARAIGRSHTSVSKWRYRRENRGCNGNVPSLAQRRILEIAKKKKLDITPEDLVYGRRVKKIKKP